MDKKGVNELRELFLSFFQSKGHYRMDSFPLIPEDDKSLLLINAGMAPLKKYFLGQAKVPGNRATTCQKCIRTPDIERVGITSRHGTYFEMLGNFSFGDYFKHDAITWAWEFCTKVVGLPVDRLHVSVFEEDDESYDIWVNEIGVKPDHMARLGREDNFWEIGSGPCGPCSEIYYDRGEKYGCGSPDCAVGCDCDRYVEFWNLVFTQFIADGEGHYSPMASRNIDTGMGLERLACIVQDVDNIFEIDTFRSIMSRVESLAGVKYKSDAAVDVSLRVITDHIRSTVFMVGDGVAPSNEGRGYVLRRLLRRAARHGRLLGINKSFLCDVCDTVIDENKNAYPALDEHRAYIKKVIRAEEERFSKTIDSGFELLNSIVEQLQKSGEKVLDGETAFKLNDTYGFPIDLTKELLAEKGMTADEEGFARLMAEQKKRARDDAKKKDVSWEADLFSACTADKTVFVGYNTTESAAKVMYLVSGTESVESAGEGDEVRVILDKTPFYAESGGQVGDRGTISAGGAVVDIIDTKKSHEGYFIHIGRVRAGELTVGDEVSATVDVVIRSATMRNHTAAHLLQAALRNVLGDHVHQAGSYVDEHRVRFDFTHFEAVKPEELKRVEDEVNRDILAAIGVITEELPIEQAKKSGAVALFGEKYGDVVRVVSVPGVSVEFCGGTHVSDTARLGLFKILFETSVAAGVRRIEATTGSGVLALIDEKQKLIVDTAEALKVPNPNDIAKKATAVMLEEKALEKQLNTLKEQMSGAAVDDMLKNPVIIGKVNLYSGSVGDKQSDELRLICDSIKDKDPMSVAVLCAANDEKAMFAVGCSAGAVAAGCNAGSIVRAIAALAGGSGGGRPEFAMAGAKELDKIGVALSGASSIIERQVNNG